MDYGIRLKHSWKSFRRHLWTLLEGLQNAYDQFSKVYLRMLLIRSERNLNICSWRTISFWMYFSLKMILLCHSKSNIVFNKIRTYNWSSRENLIFLLIYNFFLCHMRTDMNLNVLIISLRSRKIINLLLSKNKFFEYDENY